MLTWAPWAVRAGVAFYAGLHDGGYRLLFTGIRPGTVLDAPDKSALVVAVLPYATPAFGEPDPDGRARATATPPVNARDTGAPTWFRVVGADSKPIRDGDIPDDLVLGRPEVRLGDFVQAVEEWIGPRAVD